MFAHESILPGLLFGPADWILRQRGVDNSKHLTLGPGMHKILIQANTRFFTVEYMVQYYTAYRAIYNRCNTRFGLARLRGRGGSDCIDNSIRRRKGNDTLDRVNVL